MSYTLAQSEYSNLKRRLTAVRNKVAKAKTDVERIAAHKQVIAECDHATAIFEAKGFPDSWANWECCKKDSEWLISRLSPGSLMR